MKIKSTLYFIISILTVLIIGFLNTEALANNSFEATMQKLDINGDGTIDKQEIKKYAEKDFQKMDKDKNNLITKLEFTEFVCDETCKAGDCSCKDQKNNFPYIEPYFAKIDVNKNNRISLQEISKSYIKDLDNLDFNKDGKINSEDIEITYK